MNKIVVLSLEQNQKQSGFLITLQIGEEGLAPSTQKKGYLPDAPLKVYQQWQSAYLDLPIIRRLEAPLAQVVNVSQSEDCRHAIAAMGEELNRWLNDSGFQALKDKLYLKLRCSDPIRFVIQTDSYLLRQLPWHLWHFFEDYHNAEITLSPPCYDHSMITTLGLPKSKIRILAILGNSEGIDTERDKKELENIPNADILFLVEPSRQEISEQLWEQTWDILFFAGHSGKGKIAINHHESITLSELKSGLTQARRKGLHLAIFNSCDGLDLAKQLEALQIPQIIVMREPVPDSVAHKFLMYFLKALLSETSVYLAMRRARERLAETDLELDIPGASWLPIMCQNLAASPLVWHPSQSQQKKVYFGFKPFKAVFLAATIGVIGLIILGLIIKNGKLDYLEHTNLQPEFSVKYPSSWEEPIVDRITKEVKFISPLENEQDKFQEAFFINTEYFESSNLEDFSNKILKRISQDNPQMIITPRTVKLVNFNAKEVRYRSFQQDLELQIRKIWFLHNQQGYVFTYQAESNNYDKYAPDIQLFLDSFEIRTAK